MIKMKVMTIVGTRPEIIRLSCVISEMEASAVIDHTLVHTGQNYDYELYQIFFDDLDILRPNYFLEAAAGSALETIGNVLISIEKTLKDISPDCLLVLGDTNSCFAALAGKIMKIPVFHMEAGNRCFDLRVPEEINRRVVDHVSDINLCYSDIAREYLLREGISPDRIIRTGSPMFEVLKKYQSNIEASDVLGRLGLEAQNYFLVSSHRAENIDSDEGIVRFMTVLERLEAEYGLRVIVSTHPRTRKRIDIIKTKVSGNIFFLPPFGFFDYIHLQKNALITLSDSGTIFEESSILGFPAINLREVHERPEAMEESGVIMAGYNWERIHQAIEYMQENMLQKTIYTVKDYSYDNVSKKILKIILSYKDFVNQKVWHRF